MASSPIQSPASSQLSSHGSSEFGDDVKPEDADSILDDPPSDPHLMPPSKRRRIGGASSNQSTPVPQLETQYDAGEVSSDTEGSIPASPNNDQFTMMQDEDPRTHIQVRACKWEGCTAGDLANMDDLVVHLHDEHIGNRETSYPCEWIDCARKGQPHASGYALKAHMRSHTKEKPFYCALPECDRSFTRSDALAKHMRTVHETEALRPSDPVPRNYNSAHFKPQRLKLTIKPPAASNNTTTERDEIDSNATISPPLEIDGGDYTITQHDDDTDNPLLTQEELAMPPTQLFRLLRRQVHWSEQEQRRLQGEVEALEKKRRAEWLAKELVLANVMEAEMAYAFYNGGAQDGDQYVKMVDMVEEFLPGEPLPLRGADPWYRSEAELGPLAPEEVEYDRQKALLAEGAVAESSGANGKQG